MKRINATNKLFTSFSLLLLTLLLAPLNFAQSKMPAKSPTKSADKPAAQAPVQRQLVSITFLRIKPGMAPQWREFRKNETLPMLQKAAVKQQNVWATATFGAGGEFLIVTPIESLAQYDGPSPSVRALGQQGATAYGAKAAQFTESARTVAIETRPELSLPPKPDQELKIIVVTTTTIAAGRAEEFENFIKTAVLPAMKKSAPKGYLLSRVSLGGNLNEYVSAVLLDSFADLQRWREAFGKESVAAKVDAKSVGIVTNRENAIYRFAPDLSIAPAPMKDASK